MTKARIVGSVFVWWLAAAPLYAASLDMTSVTGAPGQTVEVQVTLSTMGNAISGLQNQIEFDQTGPVEIVDCDINPDIANIATRCELQEEPGVCSPGDDECECTPLENCDFVSCALISITNSNVTSFPDGVVLYTCMVKIACDAAEGDYPLDLREILAVTNDDPPVRIPTDETDGVVTVSGPVCQNGNGGGDGGGCQLQRARASTPAWLLLGPPLVILARRRRRGVQ